MKLSRIGSVAVTPGMVTVLGSTLTPASAVGHGREASAKERLPIPAGAERVHGVEGISR
jgi:hypothetical protein